jgi:hypothetical protein
MHRLTFPCPRQRTAKADTQTETSLCNPAATLIFPSCNAATREQSDRMAKPDEFKACPFCKQEIRREAVKCRFCGEWLEQVMQPPPALGPGESVVLAETGLNLPGTATHPSPASQQIVPLSGREQTFFSDFHFGPVLRDVVIIWVLTIMGGIVAGASSRGEPQGGALAISNILFGTVGFAISGCLATGNRWKHLSYVAAFSWLTSLVNILIGPVTIDQWLAGLLLWPILMGLGGGLSYVFKRKT